MYLKSFNIVKIYSDELHFQSKIAFLPTSQNGFLVVMSLNGVMIKQQVNYIANVLFSNIGLLHIHIFYTQ